MFGGKKKIVIQKELFDRALAYAREQGYAELSEWVSDLMEEEMRRGPRKPETGGAPDDEVKKRLQGLGYIS